MLPASGYSSIIVFICLLSNTSVLSWRWSSVELEDEVWTVCHTERPAGFTTRRGGGGDEVWVTVGWYGSSHG